jgi:hypothetical protein
VKAPKRDRPHLPEGYIKPDPKGMLPWTSVDKMLRVSPYFWLATIDPDGKPHLIQQWFVWIDQQVFFDGSERTKWARNLIRDPRVGFGVQNGNDTSYGDGSADIIRGTPVTLARRIAAQYGAKYGRTFKYRPKAEQYVKGYTFRIKPEKLIAFDIKKFDTSATRFTF